MQLRLLTAVEVRTITFRTIEALITASESKDTLETSSCSKLYVGVKFVSVEFTSLFVAAVPEIQIAVR